MALHVVDRMAVEDEGEGEAVLCVHGLGGSSNTWTPLMPALAGWRVLRVDLPGSARSASAGGPSSIEGLARALLGLLERLNVGAAHWLGHSLGTIVCQHAAALEPGRVRSLALFGPLAAPPESARAGLRTRAGQARREGVAGMQTIADALVQASLSTDTRQRNPAAVALVRESLMRQDAEGYARSCEALAEVKPAAVSEVAVPLLLATGDEDIVAPPQSVRALAERFASASSRRVSVFSRCGHWTPIEKPEECQRELRDFLASARARRAVS